MRTKERPLDFLSAIGLAVAGLAVRWALQPWLGPLQPLAPGFVTIAASVFFLSWRPAVLTAIVSYVGGTYLFVQPGGDVFWTRPQDVAALVTYAFSAGLIIFMGHRARMAERQLAIANAQLRDADRKKDEFLATLSHELRNPVTVISTAVATLEQREHDPRVRQTVTVLARQATLIRRLVDDLLDVGRITRGRMTLRTSLVDVRTCVEQAVEGCADAVARKQQSLVVTVPHTPVDLYVDPARMVQVLSNLIDNASKYSPERADIRVEVVDEGDARIQVTDNGPGIDPAILPHVFDLFDQGGSSSSDGLGLGLGLCKRIVEMHGGTINALSNPRGRGASFVIRLPRGATIASEQTVVATMEAQPLSRNADNR